MPCECRCGRAEVPVTPGTRHVCSGRETTAEGKPLVRFPLSPKRRRDAWMATRQQSFEEIAVVQLVQVPRQAQIRVKS